MAAKKDFEDFLSNNNISYFLYIDEVYSSRNKFYYKEDFNNRFKLIFERKYYPNEMSDYNYTFAGYLDCITKTLYEPSYDISNILEESNIIKMSSFDEISNQIEKDVIIFLKQYSVDNAGQLKKEAQETFNYKKEKLIEEYEQNVRELFVKGEIDETVPYKKISEKNAYESKFLFSRNLIYSDYLNNPVDTVLKICNWITNDSNLREDLGIMIFENEYENIYLKEILENKNGKYDYLYLNRKILDSIKDIDATNFNITINYNNESINFKLSKNIFIEDLEDCKKYSKGYDKSYERVEDFLLKHKENVDGSTSFDLKNITSITYGKKVLYENICSKQIIENIDIEEEIEI